MSSRAGRVERVLMRHHGAFAMLVYLAMTLLWDRVAVAHMESRCACGLPGDPAQYTWALVWFPHALFSGLPLLHTRAMWSPTGLNLAGATAIPFLAFLFAPVTWVWGPIATYNLLQILAPVTAAGAAYLLCRYVSKSAWAALLGGAAFGFCSYEIGQLDGHLHLVMIFCVPLAVLTVLRFLDGGLSRRRCCIQLALILLVQFFIALEVFFTLTVIGLVALALGWLLGDEQTRARIMHAARPIGFAYAVVLVVCAWFIVDLLHASAYAKDKGALYPTDGLALFTPMVYTWIGGHALEPLTSKYVAGAGETDAYVGIPMLAILISYIAVNWRRRVARWLTALVIITLLWVLGPELYLAGKPTIWLPYSLFDHLPGFDQVLQGRVAVYWALTCSVVLSLWLAGGRRHPTARWICGLLAVACLLPNILSPAASSAGAWNNPRFFSSGLYKHYLRRGETILPITWGWRSESPMWQAETHMYFKMASGYFTTSMPGGWRGPLTQDLWDDTPNVANAWRLRYLAAKRDISDVVVQGSEEPRWAPLLRAAGLRPAATVGGVTVYHVPSAWLAEHGPTRTKRTPARHRQQGKARSS